MLSDRVVSAVDSARQGAIFLDLVTDDPDGMHLTPLGREVVRFAIDQEGSIPDAIERFSSWQGSTERFATLAPSWGHLARRVIWAYPATQLLVECLQTMHLEGRERPSLVDLVQRLHADYPTFTVELFIRGTDDARARALDHDGALRSDALTDGSIYHAPTVFQLKAMYYHAGILTERGAEPHRLEPLEDEWALTIPLSDFD